jgi:predicted RNA binding protein YcfA (HicA-like mRNA interferase family)
MPTKFRDLEKMLRADGWTRVRTSGSHCIYKHPTKLPVTVPYHGANKEIAAGTLNNILKQAGLK